MIPEEKMAAVCRGLEKAFGTTTIDSAHQITRGMSSDLVFRIGVRGSAYLLRIMTRMNEQMDPHRIYACMRTASEASLTPAVRYTNPEDGISITDFVETVPLTVQQALHHLPRTLRALHDSSRFPKEFNYATAQKGFIARFRTAALLPSNELEEVFACFERLSAVYPRIDADMVSSHMDIKPDNILFDGKRIWLVDWQAGFVNDRYFDLSVAANFLLASTDEEPAYLQRYFDAEPDEYQQARFFLMRQFLHLLSASVFLTIGAGSKPIATAGELPSFEEFHRRLWDGKVNLADKDQQVLAGLVHWNRLLSGIRLPRFEEALRTVSSRNGNDVRLLFAA